MGQRIREEDIERVRAATDIVEVAEETLTVRRQRNIAWALCPFHQEKTPSFKMDSTTGLYYCFGCGAAGNVFQFVERTQGLTFSEAVEHLAGRAGIQLQYEGARAFSSRDRRGRLVEALEAAVTYYQEYLFSEDAGARQYLLSRGIGKAEIEHFRLGSSPSGWDGLVRQLRGDGFSEKDLLAAGLAFRNDRGRLTDQFRGRVMFPIFDPSGKPIAFGARALGDVKPKYKNSATGALYDKSRTLYGLNWARRVIASKRQVVVVEGYTDVIGLHQIGVTHAVATCGTALGEGHFETLRRFCPTGSGERLRVMLAFDADAAGATASRKSFALQHNFGFDIHVVELPKGSDPADLSQENPEVLLAAIESAEPLMRYKIKSDLSHFDLTLPEHRVEALRAASQSVSLHPDPLVRHEYAYEISYSTGIDVDVVRAEIEKATQSVDPSRSNAGEKSSTSSSNSKGAVRRLDELDGLILRELLVGKDEIRSALINMGELIMRGEGAKRIFKMISTPSRPDPALILSQLDEDDPARAVIGHVILDSSEPEHFDDDREAKILVHAERRVLRNELDHLEKVIRGERSDEKIADMSRRYKELQTRLRALI